MSYIHTALAAPDTGTTLENQRTRFTQAEQALATNNLPRFNALAETLRDYPLYPYLRFAELHRNLSQLKPREVEDFLTDYADTPLPAQLHATWLETLAQNQQWEAFQASYRPSSSIALECHHRRATLRAGQPRQALHEIEKLWLVGRSQPAVCDPLFAAWRQSGGLTAALAWQRVELAIAARQPDLARFLSRYLSASDRAWLDVWLALYEQPDTIERYPQLQRDHPRAGEITAYAMTRLGLRDEIKTAALWRRVSDYPGLNPSQKGRILRAIALGMATSHRYEAQAWLGRVPTAQQNASVRAWRVRVALKAGDWPAVLAYINAMPEKERTDLRWRYWRARALAALDQTEEAKGIYSTLAGIRHYYGFLAADRLGLDYSMQHTPVSPDPVGLTALAHLPAMQRARELHRLQRLTQARREWRLATRALNTTDLQQAAQLAREWGWFDQAIRTISASGHRDDLNLRFPLAYQDLIVAYAGKNRIEPAWAFAIARKESLFAPDARSPVGALGLMQLMPATGQQVARRLNTRLSSSRQLLDPETNVRFGTAYLSQLMGEYGHPVLATAAYNAGPHNVDRWLSDQSLPADIWIETISFGETRDYLAGVLAFTAVYQHQVDGSTTRLSDLMVNVVKNDGPATAK
ncbi:MAG: transglycosylase SLT domain-containing protein [Gammaproteobacteria bacterium]|nr:transglycosylase SLT domain-containing protein [Gammaproteobacteria bacterium]